jgi:type I restriction enzyme, S subunit
MGEGREIPKGWEYIMLGEIFVIERGGSPRPIDDYITDADDGINWIKIGDTKGITKYIFKTKEKIKPEGIKNSRMVYEDDFILSNSMSFGRPYIMKTTGCIHDGWLVIRTNKQIINASYLYYILSSSFVFQQFSRLAKGSTVKNLNIEAVQRVFIHLPPLSEQHRIVAKIEELFSSLDKGIESLKTAQQQLKVYRQAVLKWAFEGRLTNENVVDGELPERWRRIRLNNICNKIQDGSHFSPKIQYDEPGENRFPYITAKNIRNNHMDFSKLTYVDREFHKSIYERCNPEYGDVLLTKDGVNTGEVTLNSLKEPFSLLSSVCIFKTKKNELDSGFLKYFLQSPLGSKTVVDSMTGTAIKRIILRKIKDAEIIQPPLPEQNRIVSEIESRLSVCDKIEESIEHSLKQAESLRQSILNKAFEGRLVPQDPKDEPVSVLLERILRERAETPSSRLSKGARK